MYRFSVNSRFLVCCCREWPSSLEKVLMLRHACNTDLITLLMLPKTKSCRVPGPVYQSFITNYDGFSYYKLLDEVLLQIITNCEKVLKNWQVQLYNSRRQDYNKLRRLLQIMSEQTCYIFSIIFWKPDISQIYGGREGHCYWMFTLYLKQTPIYFWIFRLVCDCLPF